MLDHERPRGSAKLADQLWRSATSIPANIAEGVGKRSHAERRHHYTIARGSAFETASHLDIIRLLRAGEEATLDQGRRMLIEIVKMLTAMTE